MRTIHYPILVALFGLASNAFAWHDTTYITMKRLPRIARWEAEALVAGGQDLAPEDGALGGKVVVMRPGGAVLSFERELEISHYRVEIYGRVPGGENHGMLDYVLVHLKILPLGDGDPERQWSMRIAYPNLAQPSWVTYDDIFGCSVPIYRKGRYRIELWSDAKSRQDIHADFVDLRDTLGGCARKAGKTGRNYWSEEEVQAMRGGSQAGPAPTPGEMREIFKNPWQWSRQFDRNKQMIGDIGLWGRNFSKYLQGPQFDATKVIKTPGWGDFYPAEILSDEFRRECPNWPGLTEPSGPYAYVGGDLYHGNLGRIEGFLKSGDPKLACDLASWIVAFADIYPDTWVHTQGASILFLEWRQLRFNPTNELNQGFIWHYTQSISGVWLAYDAVFPWLKDNEEFAKVVGEHIPWVKNPEDVRKLIETNVLQLTADLNIRRICRGENGLWDTSMAQLCVAQGANEVSRPWMNEMFTRAFWNGTSNGGLQDHAISSMQREGTSTIGAVGYNLDARLPQIAIMLDRYRQIGGGAKYDLTDPARYPQVLNNAVFGYQHKVAGGYMPNVGDWFNFVRDLSPQKLGPVGNLRFHFKRTGSPETAYVLKHYYKESAPGLDEAAARCHADPIMHSASRVLPGFGLAILEAGSELDDFTKKRAVVVRTGYGRGHGHHDQLNIEYFAKGVRAVPDTGARNGSPYPAITDVHFCVQVDDISHQGAELNATGVGWEEAFAPLPGAPFVSAGARDQSHPHVNLYRRDVALIDSGPEDSYVIDCFRVQGGKVRTWAFHSMGPDRGATPAEHFNVEMKPSKTTVAGMEQFHNVIEGVVAEDDFQVAYDTVAEVEKYYFGEAWREGMEALHTSARLFGVKGSQVFAGGHMPGSEYWQSRRYVKVRTPEVSPEGTTHLTLTDVYRGESLIRASRELRIAGNDVGALAPRAVEIVLADGTQDTILFGSGATPNGIQADGRFALARRENGKVSLLQVVQGSFVEADGFRLGLDRPAYMAVVEKAGLDDDSFAAPKDWLAPLITDEQCFLDTAGHRTSARIEGVAKGRVRLRGPLRIYQSEVVRISEEGGYVVTRIEPPALNCHADYYENCIGAAENRKKHWRIHIEPDALWLYMQNPRHDWTYLLKDSDFPDADGDGKRMFTFEKFGKQERTVAYEISHFDEKTQILYLRIPSGDPEMAENGWIHAHCPMYSEGKTYYRKQAIYSGKTYRIRLDGAPVRADDFSDEDEDGRKVLNMFQFGNGTKVTVATYAQLRRTGPGSHELRANAPVSLRLPGVTRLRADGKRIKRTRTGDFLISAQLLREKRVILETE